MAKNGKTKQGHHAPAAAHCTNHYSRSVMQLEGVLEERLRELSLLAQENAALKRKEAALQSAVSSLAGSVSAATRAVLVSSAADNAADTMCAALRPCSPYSCSIPDHKGFLRHMQQREAAVQRTMAQLGCVESDELYSSWLLRRAFSHPERANTHLARTKAERVAYVLATVQKLGLLLGKYDLAHHPVTVMGTPRVQVDNLIDDLNERTLAFCLLAPPHRQLEMACLNMETGLPEPYPHGWWAVVIDAMQLTDEQKAALKICWEKVKPIKLALTAKYEALSAQLAQLQRRQLDQERQFELQAEHAIDAAISRKAAHQQLIGRLDQQQQPSLSYQQQQEQQQQLFAQQLQPLPHQPQQQPLHAARVWEQMQQQQQQTALQQPPLQELQHRPSIIEGVLHEHELFQFCRVLLGSDLEGMEGMSDQLPKDPLVFAATATSACTPAPTPDPAGASSHAAAAAVVQDPVCCMPMAMDAAAGAASAAASGGAQQQQQQHQGYAARMAPPQLHQEQRQFMQFSPALAAAAAMSDQRLWLQGFNPSPGPGSTPSPHGLLIMHGSESGGTTSGELGGNNDEDMALDESSGQQQQQQQEEEVSTSCTSADQPSRPHRTTSPLSKLSDTPSTSATPGPLEAAAAAAAVPAAAAIVAGHGAQGDVDVWKELAGVLPSVADQQAAAQAGGGQGQGAVPAQTTDRQQRKLERQLDKITAQLKMQQYCTHTYVLNICSKKQMALKYVNCYPYVPEAFSMCEALDELGW